MTAQAPTAKLRSPQEVIHDYFCPRAPSLPPGIGADTVLDILKTANPPLYAQVCCCVNAYCNAAAADQCRGFNPSPQTERNP